jgi:hypothetical protein
LRRSNTSKEKLKRVRDSLLWTPWIASLRNVLMYLPDYVFVDEHNRHKRLKGGQHYFPIVLNVRAYS